MQMWHHGYLFARALTIGGGTGEVQRNILAERVLGLPHDPRGLMTASAHCSSQRCALGPRIRAFSDEAESMRRLPPGARARRSSEAGLMRLGLPQQYGGAELDPVSFLEVVEEVSRSRLRRGLVRDDRVDDGAAGRVPARVRSRSASTAAIR